MSVPVPVPTLGARDAVVLTVFRSVSVRIWGGWWDVDLLGLWITESVGGVRCGEGGGGRVFLSMSMMKGFGE